MGRCRCTYLDCYRLAIVDTPEEATSLSGHDELAQLHTLQHPSRLQTSMCQPSSNQQMECLSAECLSAR